MEEEISYYKNDTVRAIERLIGSIKAWRDEGGWAKPNETELVLTKLEEAKYWALNMIDRSSVEPQS